MELLKERYFSDNDQAARRFVSTFFFAALLVNLVILAAVPEPDLDNAGAYNIHESSFCPLFVYPEADPLLRGVHSEFPLSRNLLQYVFYKFFYAMIASILFWVFWEKLRSRNPNSRLDDARALKWLVCWIFFTAAYTTALVIDSLYMQRESAVCYPLTLIQFAGFILLNVIVRSRYRHRQTEKWVLSFSKASIAIALLLPVVFLLPLPIAFIVYSLS